VWVYVKVMFIETENVISVHFPAYNIERVEQETIFLRHDYSVS